MRPNWIGAAALVALAILVASCDMPAASSQPAHGSRWDGIERAFVAAVIDGDKIRVEIGGREATVRYIGMDAPEVDHADGISEPMAAEATEANERLVKRRIVYLEKDVFETDLYGRLLHYVFLDDGTFVNAELVGLGYAEAKAYPPDVGRQQEIVGVELEARVTGRGMWAASRSSGRGVW